VSLLISGWEIVNEGTVRSLPDGPGGVFLAGFSFVHSHDHVLSPSGSHFMKNDSSLFSCFALKGDSPHDHSSLHALFGVFPACHLRFAPPRQAIKQTQTAEL
jgi:hypothetical protein